MCGIIGFTGCGRAKDVLLSGLSALEYRGYDSAGISCFTGDGKITTIKSVGKVSKLRAQVPHAAFLSGNVQNIPKGFLP